MDKELKRDLAFKHLLSSEPNIRQRNKVLSSSGFLNSITELVSKGTFRKGKSSLEGYIKRARGGSIDGVHLLMWDNYIETWVNILVVQYCFDRFDEGNFSAVHHLDEATLWGMAVLWVEKYESKYESDVAYVQAVRKALSERITQSNKNEIIRRRAEKDLYEQLENIIKTKVKDVRDMDIVLELKSPKADLILIENFEDLGVPKEYMELLIIEERKNESRKSKVSPRKVPEKAKTNSKIKSAESKAGAKKLNTIYVTTMEEVVASIIRFMQGNSKASWVFVTHSGGAKTMQVPNHVFDSAEDPLDFIKKLTNEYVQKIEIDAKLTCRIQSHVFKKLQYTKKLPKISEIKKLGYAQKYAKELGLTLVSKSSTKN